jgi:hypothetical protein
MYIFLKKREKKAFSALKSKQIRTGVMFDTEQQKFKTNDSSGTKILKII